MKKKYTPSAAAGYKRIKPLYDKAVADLAEQAHVIEQLEAERVLLATQLDNKKAKLKRAGDRVAELLRFTRAQQVQIQRVVKSLDDTTEQLVIEQRKHVSSDVLFQTQQRNRQLAQKNLELAERGDKYRGELENIRVKAAYAIITVGVLALGYALVVLK